MESNRPRNKALRLLWLFALLIGITAGARVLLDRLTELAPSYESTIHGGIGVVYVTLLVLFIMKPLVQLFGIPVRK